MKESFTNPEEANAIVDYLCAFIKEGDDLAVMTPYRTQALMIKETMQEERKNDLPEFLQSFQTIGSFEDFVSRTFKTIVISLCKTDDVSETGGTVLNSAKTLEFVLSRLDTETSSAKGKAKQSTPTIIVVGNKKSLNPLWKKAFLEANDVEIIEQ